MGRQNRTRALPQERLGDPDAGRALQGDPDEAGRPNAAATNIMLQIRPRAVR